MRGGGDGWEKAYGVNKRNEQSGKPPVKMQDDGIAFTPEQIKKAANGANLPDA